jgi:hypothetical protein
MEPLLINTKHSKTLYKIATILDDAKIDNCKIDSYMCDKSLVITVTPEIEYKCGDYIELKYSNNYEYKCIFYSDDKLHIHTFCDIDKHENIVYNKQFFIKENCKIRKLSKTEISEFNEKLTSNSYRFNVEKLKLEKLPPRAKKGEVFYYMSYAFDCIKSTDNRSDLTNKLYDSGNYFLESVNCKEFIKRVINNR